MHPAAGPLAAVGFVLQIPLQTNASWLQVRTADAEAQKTIHAVQHRVTAMRTAASLEALVELSQGLPIDWQPGSGDSLAQNPSRILSHAAPELARLRTLSLTNQSTAIPRRLQHGLRDLLLNLIYAAALFGAEPLKLGALLGNKGPFDWKQLLAQQKRNVAVEGCVSSDLGQAGFRAQPGFCCLALSSRNRYAGSLDAKVRRFPLSGRLPSRAGQRQPSCDSSPVPAAAV